MKAAIALAVVLSLGCVTASPTFGAIVAGKSVAASSSSSYSSYSSSSELNYYSSEVCTAVGFTIRDDLATCIFDELEQQFLQKKCELLNSYAVYPRDIAPHFCDLQPDSLYYDIIFIGSGPSSLGALPALAALGKRILIVDKGYLPPASAESLYYRTSLYASEYVNSFPGYIKGGEITKNFYSSNIFGGPSVLGTNTWHIGSHSLYTQLATINDEFVWDKVYNLYKGLECYKSYSHSVSVTTSTSSSSSSSASAASSYSGSTSASSASSSTTSSTTTTTTYQYSTTGTYSIFNYYGESYLTRTLSSVFDELGYSNCDSPFDLVPNKYSILPCLGDRERPSLFPYTVFQALDQYKNNIDLALRTTAKKIIFNGNKAQGVEVLTPSGQPITLYANDQVILGTGLTSTYELLINSGCGPEELLNKYNIPINFPIPSLGNSITWSPIHHGIALKFPKGYLMDDCDSDLRNLAYAFGDYEVSSSLALNYYRAYLAVKGATESNIALKFYAFGQSTSIRLRNMMNYYFQYDSSTQEYINSLINDYDILIVGTELIAPKSRGMITYKDCTETPYIDFGLYNDEHDVECMLEAIEQIRALAQTKSFLDLNCELIQFPLQNFNGDFFTPEFNKQSLFYHSIPSMYGSGGFPLGVDYQTAVVDKGLRLVGTANVRVLNTHVSPYPLSADSLAFSTFIGAYAAQVIANEYSGTIFPYIPLDNVNTGISVGSDSSSYVSRDINASSTSTDINSVSNDLGIDTSYMSSASSVSSEYEANQSDSSLYAAGNGGVIAQQYSSSNSKSEYEANQSNSSLYTNGNGGVVAQQYSSSDSKSEYEANQSNSSLYTNGNGGVVAQQYSSSDSKSEYEANQSNSSMYSTGNGVVAQQSSSASYDAQNTSSNVSSSSYSSGLGGAQASMYEASSQSSSMSAKEESASSVAVGALGVPC